MKNIYIVFCLVFLSSCVQKAMSEPDNLISEEKITNVLYDLAILNAARSTNSAILKENGIEPMTFLFLKYKIDSIQFVESNRYYASLPEKYESIYTGVNERLKNESKRMDDAKKVNDSINKLEKKNKKEALKTKPKRNDLKEVSGSVQ